MTISTCLSFITLNGNELSSPSKPIGWLNRQENTHTHTHTESKGWKRIFHTNKKNFKLEHQYLISDKINFKTKAMGDEEGLEAQLAAALSCTPKRCGFDPG